MTDYGLSDVQRAVVISKLETWLRDDRLHQINLKTLSGRGRGRRETQVPGAIYSRELLDTLQTPDAVLDEIIGAHGGLGGSFVIRAAFLGDDEQPDWEHQLSASMNLVRRPASAGKGSESAVEGIANTLSEAMASHTRQLGGLYDRLEKTSGQLADRTAAMGEQRFADVLAMTSRINQLELELLQATIRAEIAENEKSPGIIEQLGPDTVGQLVVGVLPVVSQIGSAAVRWMKAQALASEQSAGLLDAANSPGTIRACDTCGAPAGTRCINLNTGAAMNRLHVGRGATAAADQAVG